MTEAVQLALIVAVPPTLAACAALYVSVRNSTKADAIITKADNIHSLTNSNLSLVTTELKVANEKIEGLQKLVGALKPGK